MQNKYEVLEVVGEGAYGIVYKCRNKETGQYVAIKKFKEVEDDLVKKTMKRELRMLQKLTHPNIVSFLEAYKRKGNLYLIFEYIPKNLLEILQENFHGLDQKLIRHFIYQLCKSIKYLHSQNIIHRDIKPENLLVDNNMNIKLCDFGFARFLNSKNEKLTDYVATRWYRAPELLLSQGDYGFEVDYWAVGCIMGELVDGNPLFPGESEIDQLHCIQKVLGNFTKEQISLFYDNPIFNGKELLNVEKPESLEWKYLGRLSKNAISFLKGLLEIDPKKRICGDNVFQHPYLAKLYQKDIKRENEKVLEVNDNIFNEDKNINNKTSNNNENSNIEFNYNNENKSIELNNNNLNYNNINTNDNINFNNETIENLNIQTLKNKHNHLQNNNINNNIYVFQFHNNPNIQNYSKIERDNNLLSQTSITNINNINYNNFGDGFFPQEYQKQNKEKKQKNKINKIIDTNFNFISMKKQNVSKISTSTNLNDKQKDNINLLSFMSTNNIGNPTLDNAFKSYNQKNKDKDIYNNIELDSQYFNLNDSNENIRNIINKKYKILKEEEYSNNYNNKYNEFENNKMKHLFQLYKTSFTNVKNDYITNKGVKYGKNSPLTNGNYYIEGKNFYSKNNNFHLPVIPKGSNNFNNHYNLFSYNKKLDYY